MRDGRGNTALTENKTKQTKKITQCSLKQTTKKLQYKQDKKWILTGKKADEKKKKNEKH